MGTDQYWWGSINEDVIVNDLNLVAWRPGQTEGLDEKFKRSLAKGPEMYDLLKRIQSADEFDAGHLNEFYHINEYIEHGRRPSYSVMLDGKAAIVRTNIQFGNNKFDSMFSADQYARRFFGYQLHFIAHDHDWTNSIVRFTDLAGQEHNVQIIKGY